MKLKFRGVCLRVYKRVVIIYNVGIYYTYVYTETPNPLPPVEMWYFKIRVISIRVHGMYITFLEVVWKRTNKAATNEVFVLKQIIYTQVDRQHYYYYYYCVHRNYTIYLHFIHFSFHLGNRYASYHIMINAEELSLAHIRIVEKTLWKPSTNRFCFTAEYKCMYHLRLSKFCRTQYYSIVRSDCNI